MESVSAPITAELLHKKQLEETEAVLALDKSPPQTPVSVSTEVISSNRQALTDTSTSTTEQIVDIHVYVIPQEKWQHPRKLAQKKVKDHTISAGFLRVESDITLKKLRKDIKSTLSYEVVPENFTFARGVGENFTQVSSKQEYQLTVKDFLPPNSEEPALHLLPLSGNISGNQKTLSQAHRHQKVTESGTETKEKSTKNFESKPQLETTSKSQTKNTPVLVNRRAKRANSLQDWGNRKTSTSQLVSSKAQRSYSLPFGRTRSQSLHQLAVAEHRVSTPEQRVSTPCPPSPLPRIVKVKTDSGLLEIVSIETEYHRRDCPSVIEERSTEPSADSGMGDSVPSDSPTIFDARPSGQEELVEEREPEDCAGTDENEQERDTDSDIIDLDRLATPTSSQELVSLDLEKHLKKKGTVLQKEDLDPRNSVDLAAGTSLDDNVALPDVDNKSSVNRAWPPKRSQHSSGNTNVRRAPVSKGRRYRNYRKRSAIHKGPQSNTLKRKTQRVSSSSKKLRMLQKQRKEMTTRVASKSYSEKKSSRENAMSSVVLDVPKCSREFLTNRKASLAGSYHMKNNERLMNREGPAEEAELRNDAVNIQIERQNAEGKRAQLHTKVEILQVQLNRVYEQTIENWKEKWNQKKKHMFEIEEQSLRLRHELEGLVRRHHSYPTYGKEKPSTKANYKIQAMKLQYELEDIRQRLSVAKIKLNSEIQLRKSAEKAVKTMRNELSHRKVNLALSRTKHSVAPAYAASHALLPPSVVR